LNGVFAVIVMLVWVFALHGAALGTLPVDIIAWHGHEMLVGFGMAAVAGFILTAVATWTGRPPLAGRRLGVLVAAWLLGRLAMMFASRLPELFTAAVDMVFPILLCLFVAQEVFGAGNRRNYPIVVITLLLAVLDLAYHLGTTGVVPGADRIAVYMLLHLLLLLITIIGGRIVPNFSANWLRSKGSEKLPRSYSVLELAAPLLTVVTCLFATFQPVSPLTGGLAAAAALTHGLRLFFWRGLSTRSEPLLFAMHVAYAWLPIGYALTALAAFGLWVPTFAALHALAMGGIGGMILAVTTRVALAHTGRKLHAARLTVMTYWVFNIAVIIRVLGYFTSDYSLSIDLAAIGWMLTFGLFFWVYWPVLTGPSE
jgi:uncharacterized protein involved in response to NO